MAAEQGDNLDAHQDDREYEAYFAASLDAPAGGIVAIAARAMVVVLLRYERLRQRLSLRFLESPCFRSEREPRAAQL